MMQLKNHNIYLRALEIGDLDTLYEIENNENYWEISNTFQPFSKYTLTQYINNAGEDIFTSKQLRLVICLSETNETIGFVDLFDFDSYHKRAGIGILIIPSHQGKGYGNEALTTLINYAFNTLNLKQLYAHILPTNTVSIQLFTNNHFKLIGIQKDWILNNGIFKDLAFYQLIKP